MKKANGSGVRVRYGIGEWYGRLFTALTPDERQHYAMMQKMPKRSRPQMPCLPRNGRVPCSKDGGVCSIRLYEEACREGGICPVTPCGGLVTTCPCRFEQDGTTYRWIGREVLGNDEPLVVREIGFLERDPSVRKGASDDLSKEDVGRIDNVLVHPDLDPLRWCALEIQAVYFSGASMSREFAAIAAHAEADVPFPVGMRRPDFRSSGPKRLMPQLQIKAPALRRWGKKMAVVVDEPFFSALGRMEPVRDISNADIAWFVMAYRIHDTEAILEAKEVCLTTLERAVEGLTAGHPVSLETFESRIRDKLLKGTGDQSTKSP